MSIRVRFAPSPTGVLHVGGARTALYNFLFARGKGGAFILRIEDTDAVRSTDDSVAMIFDSMRWLGLEWDEGPDVGGGYGPYLQSERRAQHVKRAHELLASGRAYRCYCTAEELEARRRERSARGDVRIEDPCRNLSGAARGQLETQGRRAAVRFAMPAEGETEWRDTIRERVAFQNELLDDFVLLRSDGLPTYNFACVVDDHEMEISDVVRGDDHISNTPRQIQLHAAFGWTPPRFAHVPMILGADGARLSKRHGATSVAAYRELGIVPGALVNFLALLGWSYDGERELFTLAELIQAFRIERVGSNPAIFDTDKLEWVNSQHLKNMPEEERVRLVVGHLAARGHDLSGRSPEWRVAFVRAIGERLKTLNDAEQYGAFALRDDRIIEDAAWEQLRTKPEVAAKLEALAERIAADQSFGLESLEQATRGLAAELGLKAGELIGLARIALTGRTIAPGIFECMGLLGRERTLERLRDAARQWDEDRKRADA